MRIVICAAFCLLCSSFAFAGETDSKKRGEFKEKIAPIVEQLKERVEEQRKSNQEFVKSEIEKLDIPEEAKEKILKRMEERRSKRQERREKACEKMRGKRSNRE
jgi:regulator of protease activity HflC (stomatin/prohibitin superfamily)